MPLNNASSIGRDMGVFLSSALSAVDLPELDHASECSDSECGTPSARFGALLGLDTIAGSVSDSSDSGGDDDILRKVRSSKEDGGVDPPFEDFVSSYFPAEKFGSRMTSDIVLVVWHFSMAVLNKTHKICVRTQTTYQPSSVSTGWWVGWWLGV